VRCALARAEDALDSGRDDDARALLARAFGLARARGYEFFPVWRAEAMSRLCAFALAHGIEPDTVARLVRRRALPPPHQAGDAVDLRAWPWPVQVFALGSAFSVKVDGATLSFRGKSQKRPLEMLQALVAFGGVDVREETLAEALWPDAEGDAAAQAVSTTLHRLRRLLGNDAIVRADGRLSLNPAQVWVDALACDQRWSSLDAADHAAVLASLAIYQAPLLAGVASPWVFLGRERLARKYARAVLWSARALASDGDADPAVVLLEAAIDKEPSVESLHAELISLLRRERRDAEAADAERRWHQLGRASALSLGPGVRHGESMR
jgi:LuxR family maltose regulon positive regulatory protein